MQTNQTIPKAPTTILDKTMRAAVECNVSEVYRGEGPYQLPTPGLPPECRSPNPLVPLTQPSPLRLPQEPTHMPLAIVLMITVTIRLQAVRCCIDAGIQSYHVPEKLVFVVFWCENVQFISAVFLLKTL